MLISVRLLGLVKAEPSYVGLLGADRAPNEVDKGPFNGAARDTGGGRGMG